MSYKDKILSELLDKGYAVIDFLAIDELEVLKKNVADFEFSYSNNFNRKDYLKFDSTLFENDIELKSRFYEKMNEFFQSKLNVILPCYDILMTNFWVKESGDGEVMPHQNWTHVDEPKHRSYSIWIPLQDTDKKNGTMELMPKSHLLFFDKRVVNMDKLPYPFHFIKLELKNKLFTPINLKAGEAVIFDDGLLHYTGSNLTDSKREAIQLIVKPKKVEGVFYFKSDSQAVHKRAEKFKADSDFYIKLNLKTSANSRPQHGTSLGEIPHHSNEISKAEFLSKTNKNKTLYGSLKSWFSSGSRK
jgi:hypothetical protein